LDPAVTEQAEVSELAVTKPDRTILLGEHDGLVGGSEGLFRVAPDFGSSIMDDQLKAFAKVTFLLVISLLLHKNERRMGF
jgi:hypothetical protein